MSPIFEAVPSEFDASACPPEEREAALLRRFDALHPLQTLVLLSAEDPTTLLQWLQAERPCLFEWASLEAGPRWRIEIARREPPAGDPREVSDAIEWDHDRLDRLESTAFDAWGAGDAVAAEAAFRMFAHGLRRHIGYEESLLFPEFERRTGLAPNDGPTATLRDEHREALALVAAIELAIQDGAVPAPLVRSHLQDVLRVHHRREEEPLYPVTDSSLTREQRDDLVRRVQRFQPV